MNRKFIHRRWLWLLLLPALAGCYADREQDRQPVWTNLAHLNHLLEEITMQGEPAAIVHIYSEAPDYRWVGDADEGIACVDDAARAAVVYMRHFEVFGAPESLRRARLLLRFILRMQAENGLFYNFIWPDYSIHREGPTTQNRLSWWTARAVWALGRGMEAFRHRDAAFAGQLQRSIERVFPHLDTLLQRYPQTQVVNGFEVPTWLLHGSAADATSELLLGLSAYLRVNDSRSVRRYAARLAHGIRMMQLGDADTFPYGALLSWQHIWHAWGNSQAWALLQLSEVLENSGLLEPTLLEIQHFYPYVVEKGFPRELVFSQPVREDNTEFRYYEQIAYNIRPMFMAAVTAYRRNREPQLAALAAQIALWFWGNNPARARMYDPETGRGFDGIKGEKRINTNAGAESTIEALMVMLELDADSRLKRLVLQQLKPQQ